MKFIDFFDLVKKVNFDLGAFCNTFQYKRKELSGASRRVDNNRVFGNIKDDWAINKGGGTEIQYHIGFDESSLEVRYGFGFNTQYVPFANKRSMIEYMLP